MTVPFERSIICPVLIGRAPQLDALERRLALARDGYGQVALVVGEAGIGKSRLVAEARARALDQGFAILQGRCFEPDRALPYAPLLDLLRTFLAAHPADEIAEALGSGAAEFAKLLPELADSFLDAAPTPTLAPELEKRQCFQALTQFFTRAAARQPVLLLIEDLHWSDDTSLEWLLTLARRVASAPIFLVLTYRGDEVQPGLASLLAGLDRERLAAEVRLTALKEAEVDAMLRAIFDQRRPIRSDFLSALYALTEGNPFFIEEILKSLITAGDIFYTRGQRLCWCARAELTLATGDTTPALQIVDRLIGSAANGAAFGEGCVPRLWRLRGVALAWDHPAEAEAALLAADTGARARGLSPIRWRIQASLGRLYQAQGRRKQADTAFATARAIVEDLAAAVPDADLRAAFLRATAALIPRPPAPTPRRATKSAYDGLTAREREIATLIARGLSNHEIATTLVLSERTVATHVSNILAKLDYTTRAQIAAWASEKGLAKPR